MWNIESCQTHTFSHSCHCNRANDRDEKMKKKKKDKSRKINQRPSHFQWNNNSCLFSTHSSAICLHFIDIILLLVWFFLLCFVFSFFTHFLEFSPERLYQNYYFSKNKMLCNGKQFHFVKSINRWIRVPSTERRWKTKHVEWWN